MYGDITGVLRDAVAISFVWDLANSAASLSSTTVSWEVPLKQRFIILNCNIRLGPLQVALSLHNVKPIFCPKKLYQDRTARKYFTKARPKARKSHVSAERCHTSDKPGP